MMLVDITRIEAAERPGAVVTNITDSMPGGHYFKSQAPIVRGAVVSVRMGDIVSDAVATALVCGAGSHLPHNLPEKFARRAPTDWRMLKMVRALSGDKVTAKGTRIWLNGKVVAERYTKARARAESHCPELPYWQGERVLAADEVFLLSDPRKEVFDERGCADGRYYGVIKLALIEHTWSPLTPFEVAVLSQRANQRAQLER